MQIVSRKDLKRPIFPTTDKQVINKTQVLDWIFPARMEVLLILDNKIRINIFLDHRKSINFSFICSNKIPQVNSFDEE